MDTGPRVCELQEFWPRGSRVQTQELWHPDLVPPPHVGCSWTRDQTLLHWQAASSPLSHQGSPPGHRSQNPTPSFDHFLAPECLQPYNRHSSHFDSFVGKNKQQKKKKDTQITPFKLRMSTSIRINEAQKFLSPGRISLLLSALMCFSAPSFCSSRCYTWILCSPWNVHVKHWTQPCTVESWGPVAVLRLPVFFPPCFLLIQYTLWGFPTTATALHSLHYYHRYNPTISYQVDLFMQWGFFSPICFQEEFDATLNQRTRYS